MGWTYAELAATPQHRIEEAMTFLDVEEEARKAMGPKEG